MRILIFAIVLASFLTSQHSSAQQRSYDIMVEEGGRPLAKKPAAKPLEPASDQATKPDTPKKQATPRTYPRGSGYVPPANLPRTEAIITPQASGVYKPPPINSYGDRTRDAIHSYPLQGGIGNNPTDQQMYLRHQAN